MKNLRAKIFKIVFTWVGLNLGILSIFLLTFYKLSREVYEQETLSFDKALSLQVYSLRQPELNKFFEFITNFGADWLIYMSLGTILGLLLMKKYYYSILTAGGLGSIYFINLLMKQVVARPRPIISQLIIEKDFSFPSGHASGSSIFFMMIIFLVYKNTKSFKLRFTALILSGAMIFLIAFSRVYLGVHYPTDVLAGIIEAVIILFGIIGIDMILNKKPKQFNEGSL